MSNDLAQLAGAIRSIEERGTAKAHASAALSSGWSSVDDALGGGLRRGVVHEWFGDDMTTPLALVTHLAHQALEAESAGTSRAVLWIGRNAWPSPLVMQGSSLLARSIFIDPPDNASRLWAIDLAFRSSAVAITIADGSGVTMAHSRRLQLAAETGGSLPMLLRPAHELATFSAAGVRWRVRPMPSPLFKPRWIAELLRCKGRQPATDAQHGWVLELNRATGRVRVPALVADRLDGQAKLAEPIIPATPVPARKSA